MKNSSFLLTHIFFSAALCATNIAHAAPPLDNNSARYFATPQFEQVLTTTVAESGTPTATCNTASHIRLEKILPLQEVVMNGDAHPASGLWSVAFDLESCGAVKRHNVFVRANDGAAPFALRLPDGETRVSPSAYADIVRSLGLTSATCGEPPAVRSSVYAGKDANWQEHWEVSLCGQAVRALDLHMSEGNGGQTSWAPIKKTTWR